METHKDKKTKPVPPAMAQYVLLQTHDLIPSVVTVDESDFRPIKQETKIVEKEKKKEGENK